MAQILCLCVLSAGLASSLPLKLEGVQDTSIATLSVNIVVGRNIATSKVSAGGIATSAITPTKVEVLEVTTKSIELKSQVFQNDGRFDASFSATMSASVSNSVTSTWNTGGTPKTQDKISYNVEFPGTEVGDETSSEVIFSQMWGIGGSHITSVTLGSSDGVTVTVKSHHTVNAVLSATRGVMKARITYTDNNNHESTEDIEIDYYFDGQITTHDSKTNEIQSIFYL